MTPGEILKVLSSGQSLLRSFTVPEGQNIFESLWRTREQRVWLKGQVSEGISRPQLIQELLGESQPSLEGYLFPRLQRDQHETPESIVRAMVGRFQLVYAELEKPKSFRFSRHQERLWPASSKRKLGLERRDPDLSFPESAQQGHALGKAILRSYKWKSAVSLW